MISEQRQGYRPRRGLQAARGAGMVRVLLASERPAESGPPHTKGSSMTSMSEQLGDEIRAGDKVRQRDTEEEGDVIDVLPFYGGFQDGQYTVLLVVVVKWKGTRQRTVMRVDDLIKLN
jgi:hypothetical protein